MPKRKTPETILAAVDAYEAVQSAAPQGDDRYQSKSARTCAKVEPNPMRQVLKQLNRAAYNAARDEHGMVTPEAYEGTVAPAKRDLADILEEEARAALKHAALVRGTAGYGEAVAGAAKIIDRMRLLREQATSITHDVRSQDEADQRILVILQRGLERLQSPPEDEGPVIDVEGRPG